MSDKETSGEIATIAGHVLNLEPQQAGRNEIHSYNDLLTQAKKLAGSALSQRELIQKQMDGEDIFVLGSSAIELGSVSAAHGVIGNYEIHATVEGGLNFRPVPQIEQSNFDFYVDGYTMKGTDTVGEILVTGPDGTRVVLKSSQLTAFLERRLSPGNFPPE